MTIIKTFIEKLACCRSSETKENMEQLPEERTHWFSIYISTIFILLDGIQYSMVIVSMWPYLNKIDPSPSIKLFGYIMAAFSLGQAIASPIVGYWSNTVKSVKPPLTLTLTIMMLANILYGCTELFPVKDRAYILMVARFVAGFAAGDVAVLRGYAANAATLDDRPRAIVITSASWNLGMAFGPAIPAIFSFLNWKISEHLHINMYTAPAWLSFINNIISMIVLHTIFIDKAVSVDEENNTISIEKLTFLRKILAPTDSQQHSMNKFAICVCIITRFFLLLVFTNTETIGSLFVMTMYDWDNTQAVQYYGSITLGQGVVTFLGNLVLFFWLGKFIGKRNLERLVIVFGLSMMLFFYFLTFPWRFWSEKLKYSMNQTNSSTEVYGCDSTTYQWCPTTHQVPLILYVVGMVLVLSVAFLISFNPLCIFYSKLLGKTRQGTMTGVLMTAGSIARTVGPIVVTILFGKFGPELTWGLEIIVLVIIIIPWVVFYKKMTPNT